MAVIVTVPERIAVTTPASVTVAIVGLLEEKVSVPAPVLVAVRAPVEPATSDSGAGAIVSVLGANVTVTVTSVVAPA